MANGVFFYSYEDQGMRAVEAHRAQRQRSLILIGAIALAALTLISTVAVRFATPHQAETANKVAGASNFIALIVLLAAAYNYLFPLKTRGKKVISIPLFPKHGPDSTKLGQQQREHYRFTHIIFVPVDWFSPDYPAHVHF